MASEVHVAFLWHMHQPWYLLPDSELALLPWTRLRATKDYTDMARFIEEGEARVTVNFSGSLTEQLRLYAAGKVSDPYLPSTATPEAFAEVRSGVVPMPLARRGLPAPDLSALRAQAATPEGAGDLWGWFLLAWTAQTALEEDPALKELARKGRFSGRDLEVIEERHRELLAQVLPRYRRLAEDGLIGLSATPFYHPILPLLVDSAAARQAHPREEIPHFSAPQDARTQVLRALVHHEGVFGKRASGMWPAEGAVSLEAAALFAEAGVGWIATDGEILTRTLGRSPLPEELYRPWRLPTPKGEIAVLFRDTFLSNRVSFDYHGWHPEDAVGELLRRFSEVGRTWRGEEPPLVLIAMDGENAWDHYERNGRPFHAELYRRLSSTSGVRLTTIADYLQRFGTGGILPGLWSGSWIYADFRTWIGHPEQNRAWQALAATREAVAAATPDRQGRALEHLYVAEGSDWFWWYSPYHSSPHEPVFDRLFRAHLARAYVEAGQAPPRELASALS